MAVVSANLRRDGGVISYLNNPNGLQSADERFYNIKKNSKMFSIIIVIVNNTFLVEKNPINILQIVIRVKYVNI